MQFPPICRGQTSVEPPECSNSQRPGAMGPTTGSAIPAKQEHALEISSTGRPESRNLAEIPSRHGLSGRWRELLTDSRPRARIRRNWLRSAVPASPAGRTTHPRHVRSLAGHAGYFTTAALQAASCSSACTRPSSPWRFARLASAIACSSLPFSASLRASRSSFFVSRHS